MVDRNIINIFCPPAQSRGQQILKINKCRKLEQMQERLHSSSGVVWVKVPSGGSTNFQKWRRKTVYQSHRHLSQMHTMDFYTEKGGFLRKKLWANRGRPPPFESATGTQESDRIM